MTARPDPFRTHVADQVLAALAETAPMPLSTPAVQDRTSYGVRYGQLVYQVLTRLPARWRRSRPRAASPSTGGGWLPRSACPR